MTSFADRAQLLIKTAAKLATLQGHFDEKKILEKAKARLVETGYDNWNGGITFFTLVLEIPLDLYSKIEDSRKKFEETIRERMANITRTDAGNTISEVIITPILLDETTEAEDAEESDTEIVPSFWQPGYFRLFISHSSKIKETAHALKEALAQFQIAAFVAHEDIEPSLEWQSEIENALRTMDALVAMITPEFTSSRWCDQEVGFALGKSKFVLPLTTEVTPYGFLAKIQALKIKDLDIIEVARKISDILIQKPAPSQRMVEALVESLVTSSSWNTSRRIMTLLEKAPSLNSSQIARLITSSEENVDVRQALMGSSTVPKRIQALIKRLSA